MNEGTGSSDIEGGKVAVTSEGARIGVASDSVSNSDDSCGSLADVPCEEVFFDRRAFFDICLVRFDFDGAGEDEAAVRFDEAIAEVEEVDGIVGISTTVC